MSAVPEFYRRRPENAITHLYSDVFHTDFITSYCRSCLSTTIYHVFEGKETRKHLNSSRLVSASRIVRQDLTSPNLTHALRTPHLFSGPHDSPRRTIPSPGTSDYQIEFAEGASTRQERKGLSSLLGQGFQKYPENRHARRFKQES